MSSVESSSVKPPLRLLPEEGRTGLGKEALKQALLESLFFLQGKFPALAARRDDYAALAYLVRDR